MTNAQYRSILPFLHRKSARQKIIIFLIADGYTVPDLLKMQAKDLRGLCLPVDIAVLVDELLEGRKSGSAFVYPTAGAIPYSAFHRLIRETTGKVLGRGKTMSPQKFRQWVKTQ